VFLLSVKFDTQTPTESMIFIVTIYLSYCNQVRLGFRLTSNKNDIKTNRQILRQNLWSNSM
jgi:hypothetical protein